MVPKQTANGEFMYDEKFYGYTLDELARMCHKELANVSGWKYVELRKGTFGYDNMVMSVGRVMRGGEKGEDGMARLVHEGWVSNYIFWRDTKHYMTNLEYVKPFNPLGDIRRELCAKLAYDELPEDEKEKDLVIARVLIKVLV